jgi:hypothetical protein
VSPAFARAEPQLFVSDLVAVFDPAVRAREHLLSATIALDDASALVAEYDAAGVDFAQPLRIEPWALRRLSCANPTAICCSLPATREREVAAEGPSLFRNGSDPL